MSLKKPKFWDYKKPNFLAYLLFPISLLLQIFNPHKYNHDVRKLKIKKICIGNFYIGGTGKTSLSIKINEILNKKNIKSCFIKKFYKNQRDEQRILENSGRLFLSRNRIDALKQAEKENFHTAIFDDGLQDKSIEYDKSFVCFNTINWIGNGMTIPSGPLRENLKNLKKYKHVFLNGNLENIQIYKEKILEINSDITIHIGKYEIKNLGDFNINEKYLAFSGIGNHQTFISMMKSYSFEILRDIEFPDHYEYLQNDIDKILNEAKKLGCKIITTEKDYLRLENKINDKINFIKSELKILDENKLIQSII